MPMRRTVGISLACFVTSACVAAETPEISASHYPGDSTESTPCGGAHDERGEQRRANFEPGGDACCAPALGGSRRGNHATVKHPLVV